MKRRRKNTPLSKNDKAVIRKELTRALLLAVMLVFVFCVFTGCVTQAEIDEAIASAPRRTAEPIEDIATGTSLDPEDETPKDLLGQIAGMLDSRSQSMQIIGLITILSIAPSILIMLTCFVRIIMVLSFTRNAMGLQQMPPNQVLVGLALFLTLFIMSPVIEEIKTEAYIPYVAEQIELDEAIERGAEPLKRFMLRQTRTNDLGMFYSFTDEEVPEDITETPMKILIPAFLTSELRRAFQIGFFIYIPFIVIDMIVASTLMAMGMMMLPPVVISLPFKVLLFVLVDGWALTMQSLVASFG